MGKDLRTILKDLTVQIQGCIGCAVSDRTGL